MRTKRYNGLALLALAIFISGSAANQAAAQVPASNASNASSATESAEADKVLYDKAMKDLDHSRFETARLSLQTLINTYPDSEYLAKAKLAIADSYYKEGGTTGLTQAVAEYQDFITFFPFLDEASYAQMQIAMAHYRRMEKADRDRSEALEAEAALQIFLQKYPNTELTPKAEQRLREVQEVLADGDYRIATFYFLRRADKAAAPRLIDLVNRYPLYSAADRANWMLASIYERNEHNDVAATYYTRLVKEYPLSPLAADAKGKLVKFGDPVPQPDPTALVRMQKEQQMPRERPGFLKRPAGLLKTGPDVSTAARIGMPTLTPESDDATDTLSPGAGLTVVASGVASTGSTASTGGTGAYVLATPGASDPSAAPLGTAANPVNAAGASDPSAAGGSAPAVGGQVIGTGSGTANATPGQSATVDSSSQASQTTNAGESSSGKKKKKKSKNQVQSQPQPQSQSPSQPQ